MNSSIAAILLLSIEFILDCCLLILTQSLSPLPSNSKETVLLEIKADKPSVFTPKLLKWDDITIPE